MAAVLLATALVAARASAAFESVFPLVPNTFPNITACTSVPSFFSCENTTAIQNTCCSPTPGGLVLQTQYWNTYTGLEQEGQLLPKGSWTIHGLWPDNCDGFVLLTVHIDLALTVRRMKVLQPVLWIISSIRPSAVAIVLS